MNVMVTVFSLLLFHLPYYNSPFSLVISFLKSVHIKVIVAFYLTMTDASHRM
jgi:hypothetical protein